MTKRLVRILAGLCSLLVVACDGRNSLPEAFTCENVRALTLGDSKAAVRQRLGNPVTVTRGPDFGRPESTERWDWARYGNQDQMFGIEFDGEHLTRVTAYRYRWPADQEGLFGLTSEGRWEGNRFASFFRCR